MLQTSQSTEQVMGSKLEIWPVQPNQSCLVQGKIAPTVFILPHKAKQTLQELCKNTSIGNEKLKTSELAQKNLLVKLKSHVVHILSLF